MTQINDLVGKDIGRLTVVRQSGSNGRGRAMWLCQCSCGNEKVILGDHLIRRDKKGVRSCGCLQRESRTKHGAYLPNADIRFYVKQFLLQSLRDRAKRRGYESDLELNDMPEIPDNCPVFGFPLKLSRKGNGGVGKGRGNNRCDNSPTIDRMNPNLPYLKKYKDNLVVISWRANRLKSDGSLSEFEHIVEYMRHGGILKECESSLIDSKSIKVYGDNEAQAKAA
jgi:hypothetical protein